MRHWFILISMFFFLILVDREFAQLKSICSHPLQFGNASQSVNYPGDSRYDVKYYRIDLLVDYTNRQISGSTAIIISPINSELSSCYFDLSSQMQVDSVFCDSIRIQFTAHDNIVSLNLPRLYGGGENITIVVYYHGTPVGSGFGSFTFDEHNGNPAVYTLSEPYGAKDWFVCKDTPADKADSADIIITAKDYFKVASNGTLVSEESLPDNLKKTHWRVSYPIAHYLLMIAMTNYTVYNQYWKYNSTDSMLIANYIYPEDFSSAKEYLDKTPEMLSLYSNLFGLYPFVREKYGHAQFGWGGGMEHQTCTSLGGFSDLLIAHELGHQWFGDKITCKDWNNIWMNEGFATFCEVLYYEYKGGKESYQGIITDKIFSARLAKGSLFATDISNVSAIFDYPRSYAKGCVVLYMLRYILGDSLFFQGLKSYLTTPALSYASANTEDFKSVMENVSGQSLAYFFNEWVYGVGYPVYSPEVSVAKINGSNNYNINIVLTQVQESSTVFTMPIELQFSDGVRDTLIQVVNSLKTQGFSFTLSFKPTRVLIDPSQKILRDVVAFVFPEQNIVQPDYVLYQNYPNPFNPVTTIAFSVQRAGMLHLNLYTSSGELVRVLYSNYTSRGSYTVRIDSRNLSSGVYFYSLETADTRLTKPMVVVK